MVSTSSRLDPLLFSDVFLAAVDGVAGGLIRVVGSGSGVAAHGGAETPRPHTHVLG